MHRQTPPLPLKAGRRKLHLTKLFFKERRAGEWPQGWHWRRLDEEAAERRSFVGEEGNPVVLCRRCTNGGAGIQMCVIDPSPEVERDGKLYCEMRAPGNTSAFRIFSCIRQRGGLNWRSASPQSSSVPFQSRIWEHG